MCELPETITARTPSGLRLINRRDIVVLGEFWERVEIFGQRDEWDDQDESYETRCHLGRYREKEGWLSVRRLRLSVEEDALWEYELQMHTPEEIHSIILAQSVNISQNEQGRLATYVAPIDKQSPRTDVLQLHPYQEVLCFYGADEAVKRDTMGAALKILGICLIIIEKRKKLGRATQELISAVTTMSEALRPLQMSSQVEFVSTENGLHATVPLWAVDEKGMRIFKPTPKDQAAALISAVRKCIKVAKQSNRLMPAALKHKLLVCAINCSKNSVDEETRAEIYQRLSKGWKGKKPSKEVFGLSSSQASDRLTQLLKKYHIETPDSGVSPEVQVFCYLAKLCPAQSWPTVKSLCDGLFSVGIHRDGREIADFFKVNELEHPLAQVGRKPEDGDAKWVDDIVRRVKRAAK